MDGTLGRDKIAANHSAVAEMGMKNDGRERSQLSKPTAIWQLFASGRRMMTLRTSLLGKPALDLLKQCRWQLPVVAAFTVDRPDVWSGPDRTVALCQNNPGPLIIKS
jgi:hypothetical protein